MNGKVFAAGDMFTVAYPFSRVVFDDMTADVSGVGYTRSVTWKPGADGGYSYNPHSSNDYLLADGEGAMILTVVSVHQPGRYPTRVFFTRQWRDPDGRTFGKNKLHVVTAEKFRRISTRFGHDWKVEDRGRDAVLAAAEPKAVPA